MKKVAFLTTVFPMKESFLLEFFNSLTQQTYKDFDIIIVNDGLENFNYFIEKFAELNFIIISGCSNIAKNREIGINYCINNNYDILIFGDSDDYFSENRVEKSIEFLKESDIVVNDLSLFTDKEIYKEKYISNRIDNKFKIDFEFIKNKNIFGLSNTAIRLKGLDIVTIPSDLNVVDWYLFSILLLKKRIAIFSNEMITFYRQYNLNMIGLSSITKEVYENSIKIKKSHYKSLLKIYKNNFFKDELERLEKSDYNNIDKNLKNPLWWELI